MKLGPYELLSEIGQGGMGVVYRARSADGREVAVKVLLQEDPDAAAAFERERRLLAGFTQAEGFVPILDAGSAEGRPYLVMPFFPGGTLRARLATGALPREDAVSLVSKLATALGRAHERGIVHRDVKPENVLFTAKGEPLVADLGLAKHFRRGVLGASGTVSLSVTGSIGGTPGYMAPELIQDAKRATPPSDVFALGVILHECLAGERPFPGKSALAYVEALAKGRLPLPGRVARFEPVLARMLARDPRERFPDGHAVARALATASTRRGPLLSFALILVALAATGLGLALAGRDSVPAPAPPPVPVPIPVPVSAADRDRARRLEAIAITVQAQEAVSRGELDRASEEATRAIDRDPGCVEAWFVRGRASMALADYGRAIADLTRAIELAPGLADALESRAACRNRRGDGDGAFEDLNRALAISPLRAEFVANRAAWWLQKGDATTAIADATRAIELDPKLGLPWVIRATVHLSLNQLDAALADANKAVEVVPESEAPWRIRGCVRGRMGQYALAIEDLTVAVRRDPENQETWTVRGDVYKELGEKDAARSDYNRALGIIPKGHPIAAAVHRRLSELGE
jgi:tetratricopeptide (TPR) repeat protein